MEGCQFQALLTGRENTYFERSVHHLGISTENRSAIPNGDVTNENQFLDQMNRVAKDGSFGERLSVLLVCDFILTLDSTMLRCFRSSKCDSSRHFLGSQPYEQVAAL